MRLPKNFNPDMDSESPEFDMFTVAAPATTPLQGAKVQPSTPVGAAQASDGKKPPVAERKSGMEKASLRRNKALSFQARDILKLQAVADMENPPMGGVCRSLFLKNNGWEAQYWWMVDSNGPAEMRDVCKCILSAQALRNIILAQLLSTKAVGAMEGDPEILEKYIYMKDRVDARITASVQIMSSLFSVSPVPRNQPAVQLNVAGLQQIIKGESQPHADPVQKINEDEDVSCGTV
jgi:hypothetical protein